MTAPVAMGSTGCFFWHFSTTQPQLETKSGVGQTPGIGVPGGLSCGCGGLQGTGPARWLPAEGNMKHGGFPLLTPCGLEA